MNIGKRIIAVGCALFLLQAFYGMLIICAMGAGWIDPRLPPFGLMAVSLLVILAGLILYALEYLYRAWRKS